MITYSTGQVVLDILKVTFSIAIHFCTSYSMSEFMCREQLFKPSDAFVGFQVDMPAAVVFEASSVLNKENTITDEDKEKVRLKSRH